MIKYGNENEVCILIGDIDYVCFESDYMVLEFDMIVNNISLCSFIIDGEKCAGVCNGLELRNWFIKNLDIFFVEEDFPLGIKAENGQDFYKKIGELFPDSDDDYYSEEEEKELSRLYDIRYNWSQRHSWFDTRSGLIVPDVDFRRVGEYIEISWNSKNLYKRDGVEFINPVGCVSVDAKNFINVIDSFISSKIFYNK